MKAIRQTYTQEMHCCGPIDEEPELIVEFHDGGGGEYVVIHAKDWAIDDKDVDEFCAMIKEAVSGCVDIS